MINQIINHPELVDFFDDEAQVFNEQHIIAPNEFNVKPDRVVIKIIWLLYWIIKLENINQSMKNRFKIMLESLSK